MIGLSFRRVVGFTLIELMMVVAIIGILSVIAVPAYRENMRKSYRAEGMAALQELAQAMERHYATNFTYLSAAAGGANTGAPAATVYGFATTPKEGSEFVAYNLLITAASINSYTVQAQPTGTQASDKCGTLQITHVGVKTATGTASLCW